MNILKYNISYNGYSQYCLYVYNVYTLKKINYIVQTKTHLFREKLQFIHLSYERVDRTYDLRMLPAIWTTWYFV